MCIQSHRIWFDWIFENGQKGEKSQWSDDQSLFGDIGTYKWIEWDAKTTENYDKIAPRHFPHNPGGNKLKHILQWTLR